MLNAVLTAHNHHTWSVCWFSGGYHGYQDESYGGPYEGRRMGPPMGGPRRGGTSQRYGGQYGPPPPPPGEYGAHADSPVIMVYGLDPSKINADRVFNIFCLYGNVERVCETKTRFLFCQNTDSYSFI